MTFPGGGCLVIPRERWQRALLAIATLALLSVVGWFGFLQWIFAQLEPAPLAHEAAPSGLTSLSATSCKGCHPDQYTDWAGSMMSKSIVDPIFLADFVAQGQPFVCLRCHSPLPQQQPQRTIGMMNLSPVVGFGLANLEFDPVLQLEGVTCVACHLRDGAMVGTIADPVGAPHPVRYDPQFGNGDLCARCHQREPPPFSGLDRPMPDTHGENERWRAATGRTEGCVDCHMPKAERPAAVGGPVRTVRRHMFDGAWGGQVLWHAVSITHTEIDGSEITITVRNNGGHSVPTADPMRALLVGAVAKEGNNPVDSQYVTLARRVPLPRLRDEGDDVLVAGEERTVTVKLDPEAFARADRLYVEVLLDRLAFPPPGVDPKTVQRRPNRALVDILRLK
jgi:hypothetical protein